jgi:CRP-like cAMP-binding protein
VLDLLKRASALASCALFDGLAPAAVLRLAERAAVRVLAPGDRVTTDAMVWVVASGALAVAAHGVVAEIATISTRRRAGTSAGPGGALGAIRVVAPATKPVVAVAAEASVLVALELDDLRDVLEEDPVALAALAEAVSRALLQDEA